MRGIPSKSPHAETLSRTTSFHNAGLGELQNLQSFDQQSVRHREICLARMVIVSLGIKRFQVRVERPRSIPPCVEWTIPGALVFPVDAKVSITTKVSDVA